MLKCFIFCITSCKILVKLTVNTESRRKVKITWALTVKLCTCVRLIKSDNSHVAYQIKADDAGVVANILPTDTPSTHGVGSKGQTISFFWSSHVAYQIKGNWAQSTMKANMLSLKHISQLIFTYFSFWIPINMYFGKLWRPRWNLWKAAIHQGLHCLLKKI